MAAKGKIQVKLFLTPKAHDTLKKGKELTGESMSVQVENVIDEVLRPELLDLQPDLFEE